MGLLRLSWFLLWPRYFYYRSAKSAYLRFGWLWGSQAKSLLKYIVIYITFEILTRFQYIEYTRYIICTFYAFRKLHKCMEFPMCFCYMSSSIVKLTEKFASLQKNGSDIPVYTFTTHIFKHRHPPAWLGISSQTAAQSFPGWPGISEPLCHFQGHNRHKGR